MIYEANEPSSACRLWRIFMVETSTPPFAERANYRTWSELVNARAFEIPIPKF